MNTLICIIISCSIFIAIHAEDQKDYAEVAPNAEPEVEVLPNNVIPRKTKRGAYGYGYGYGLAPYGYGDLYGFGYPYRTYSYSPYRFLYPSYSGYGYYGGYGGYGGYGYGW